jgi:GTP-sensing pleiotropic transcriptional regulator CodY
MATSMNASLLDKTQRVAQALRDLGPTARLEAVAETLAAALGTAVTVVGRGGQVLADVPYADPEPGRGAPAAKGRRARHGEARGSVAVLEAATPTEIAIQAAGDPLGTLVVGRAEADLSEADRVVLELGLVALAWGLAQARDARDSEEARQEAAVKVALEALSYSELAAVQQLLAALNGEQGLIITSQIADRMGITRSVIVNALRKLESAGVVETRSLGMKGTHIRVLNPRLRPTLAKIRI